jgi:hypothetical protein
MTLEQRKQAFVKLGEEIKASLNLEIDPETLTIRQKQLRELSERVHLSNPWFTAKQVSNALNGIAEMLKKKSLDHWLSAYHIPQENAAPKVIGVVMAGNIPAVGFHDFLCILISGNRILAKLSSSDSVLIPALAAMLCGIEPGFTELINFTKERLGSIDAIIATGSDNSSRYFEYYFAKYPNIIRKNRTSVAILSGAESETEYKAVFEDIFQYFGQGCRSVSKLFIPAEFDMIRFLDASADWNEVALHNKYLNNYEYNKAIYLVNGVPHYDTGFLLLKEDASFHSPIGVVYYEKYNDVDELKLKLEEMKDQLQCTVASPISGFSGQAFGTSQQPGPADYADGFDTMAFLLKL